MDKERILEWMSWTENYRICGYKNRDGVQRLTLMPLSGSKEVCYRTYRPDYPNFSYFLTKNPWWKRLLLCGKYAGTYQKTITIGPHRIIVREAVDDKAFWQADAEKNPVLAQLVAEGEKRLVVFRQALKAYFADMALKTKNDMYPFQNFLYKELCQRHPEKKIGLEYVRLLLCRCFQEDNKPQNIFECLKNPLEYLYLALCKGFPYESIITGYVNCVYAALCNCFYGDVKALGLLLESSETMIMKSGGGVDDCRQFMRFPKLLDLLVEYLEC